jgi:glycosyltransferase involved in cell wall biosynthesis
MRIVFDCRYTRIGRHDGISRYTSSLVTELAKLHPVIMLINDHRQLDMLPDLPWQLVSAPTSAREPWVARQVNKLNPDIVFTPMQTMGSWGRKYRLVLTVHDLIYYRNRTPPRDLAWPIRLLWRAYHLAWWPQRMLLNRSDSVVTVSRTTRDLIREHKLTRKPVSVVENAAEISARAAEAAQHRSAPATKSLVYMGSFMPYKNVDTLVRAVAELPGYELHLMSSIANEEQARLTALAPSARLIFHNGASDDIYTEQLLRATALVSASLDEGFGIPVIEAMGLGTPAIISDIPIFREIGGEAALYFAPREPGALVAAIRSLEATDAWAEKSSLSRVQAARFNWHASAERLLGVLTATAERTNRRLS